jgi:hypothetical protein
MWKIEFLRSGSEEKEKVGQPLTVGTTAYWRARLRERF